MTSPITIAVNHNFLISPRYLPLQEIEIKSFYTGSDLSSANDECLELGFLVKRVKNIVALKRVLRE